MFPWKLYKEETNENIRLRKLPSVLLRIGECPSNSPFLKK